MTKINLKGKLIGVAALETGNALAILGMGGTTTNTIGTYAAEGFDASSKIGYGLVLRHNAITASCSVQSIAGSQGRNGTVLNRDLLTRLQVSNTAVNLTTIIGAPSASTLPIVSRNLSVAETRAILGMASSSVFTIVLEATGQTSVLVIDDGIVASPLELGLFSRG
jgi:hypothetical protein